MKLYRLSKSNCIRTSVTLVHQRRNSSFAHSSHIRESKSWWKVSLPLLSTAPSFYSLPAKTLNGLIFYAWFFFYFVLFMFVVKIWCSRRSFLLHLFLVWLLDSSDFYYFLDLLYFFLRIRNEMSIFLFFFPRILNEISIVSWASIFLVLWRFAS